MLYELNVEALLRIRSPELQKGLTQYIYLVHRFHSKEMGEDFQREYNKFFGLNGVRGRNEVFKKGYYKYMECNRGNEELSFKEVLKALKKLPPGNVERSFGAKLLSMINPKKFLPWDENVKESLKKIGVFSQGKAEFGIKVPSKNCICEWDEFYTKYCEWCRTFIKSAQGKRWIAQFNDWFSNEYWDWFTNSSRKTKTIDALVKWLHEEGYTKKAKSIQNSITDVKVIDLILWQAGGSKARNNPEIWYQTK